MFAVVLTLALGAGCRRSGSNRSPPAAAPASPASPQTVSIDLAHDIRESGLQLCLHEDGPAQPGSIGGSECWAVQKLPGKNFYFYFAIDPAFKWAESMDVVIAVEYYDNTPGYFFVQFDGSHTNDGKKGVYTRAGDTETLTGAGTWKKAYFLARQAGFKNAQNARSDFRLETHVPELCVRRVTVMRLDALEAASAPRR